MGQPTFFQDNDARAARQPEVPDASFSNGVNLGGSCAPGIGVNIGEGAVVGTPNQFTLLDQNEAIRVPQDSESIGGEALGDGIEGPGTQPVLTGVNPTETEKANGQDAGTSIDGSITVNGSANLQTLAAGWVGTAI